jgi:hypothetical protein
MMSTILKWKKALVTNEDFLHHHKILGILVLTSFVFRLSQLFDDMGFLTYPAWTIPTIFVHWLLPASAFQFRIPTRRIRDGGRIWPQYRWHALTFTSRSCLTLLLYHYEQVHHLPPHYIWNYLIVMANMAAADYATHVYGPDLSSNTIRDLEGPAFVKFIFSVMQFNASVGLLFGLRCYSIPFFMLYAVHITPFIGTLRRKGLFTSNAGGATLYGMLLVGGFLAQSIQYHQAGGEILHLFVRSMVLSAALLRLTPFIPSSCRILQNKYVIATMMYSIISYIRPMLLLQPDLSSVASSTTPAVPSLFSLSSVWVRQYEPKQLHDFVYNIVTDLWTMRIIVVTLLGGLVASCYVKVRSGYYPQDVKDAKKKI